MKELTYSQIIAENRRLEKLAKDKPLRILVVANTVVENLRDYLEYELRSHGMHAAVDIAAYDNAMQESSRLQHDVLILWLDTWNLAPALHTGHLFEDPEVLQALEKNVKTQINTIVKDNEHLPLIVINTFNNLLDPGFPFKKSNMQTLAGNLNAYLYSISAPNVFVFDTGHILLSLPEKSAISRKQFYLFNTLYTNLFFSRYSHHLKFVLLGLKGKTKKALIMDCDNTLWSGIVGEDGFDSIRMGYDSPEGRPFHEVQQMLLGLARQGVVIGICSKNNPKDVQQVIDHHPDMLLGDENITIKKVNWEPKPHNVKQIAKELNIGTDSLVFWDDNEFEVQMMREMLPEVLSFQVPGKTYEYPGVFREQMGWFFKRNITAEDLQKADLYKAQSRREKEKDRFTDITEYLQSLSLEIIIEHQPQKHLGRLAQISQKTNQFNLSTKRYEVADIKSMIADEHTDVLPFHVKDRFGEYGLTGLCIVRYDASTAFLDTFLMSCRVLGRQLEQAFINHLLARLREKGVSRLEAEYVPTPKNQQVARFFGEMGFAARETNEGTTVFSCQVKHFSPASTDFITISSSNDE